MTVFYTHEHFKRTTLKEARAFFRDFDVVRWLIVWCALRNNLFVSSVKMPLSDDYPLKGFSEAQVSGRMKEH